jgi:hypothetical protein
MNSTERSDSVDPDCGLKTRTIDGDRETWTVVIGTRAVRQERGGVKELLDEVANFMNPCKTADRTAGFACF